MTPGYTAKTRRKSRQFGLHLGGLDKRQQRRRVRRMGRHYRRLGDLLGCSPEEAAEMFGAVSRRVEFLRGEYLSAGDHFHYRADAISMPVLNDPWSLNHLKVSFI